MSLILYEVCHDQPTRMSFYLSNCSLIRERVFNHSQITLPECPSCSACVVGLVNSPPFSLPLAKPLPQHSISTEPSPLLKIVEFLRRSIGSHLKSLILLDDQLSIQIRSLWPLRCALSKERKHHQSDHPSTPRPSGHPKHDSPLD